MIRNKQINLRATEEEMVKLKTNARTANMTLCEYLRQAGIHARIETRPGLDEIRTINALLKEINPIGNNLNQIAARLNAGLPLSPGETNELQRQLSENIRLIRELKTLLQ